MANITPLFKAGKDDRFSPASYRGIPLNAVLSKTVERVVKEQLVEQLELKQVLDDRQFGFRNRRSTSQLLAVAANDWLLARDQGQTTAVVFIDLSKAFDCVLHQRLLVHLQSAGIAGTALSWFSAIFQIVHNVL